MRNLVIIPTYNEKECIVDILTAVLAVDTELNILVVDDNSPDGTAQIVSELQKNNPRVHLLVRKGKEGLGKAYLAGFQWGLEKGYDVLVEMDADFSHRPVDLKTLLSKISNADFVIGSRWVKGGSTLNWSFLRKLISRGGSLYSTLILGYPILDWTGGFNAWKRHVLLGIDLPTIQSNGYSFQIELKFRASKKGFKGLESPILFEDRRVGQSKMSLKIVLEAFYKVWLIRFHR